MRDAFHGALSLGQTDAVFQARHPPRHRESAPDLPEPEKILSQPRSGLGKCYVLWPRDCESCLLSGNFLQYPIRNSIDQPGAK